MGTAISEVIARFRPTALIIALTLTVLAGFIIWRDAPYAETIVGVIVGALAGGFDKLTKDPDEETRIVPPTAGPAAPGPSSTV